MCQLHITTLRGFTLNRETPGYTTMPQGNLLKYLVLKMCSYKSGSFFPGTIISVDLLFRGQYFSGFMWFTVILNCFNCFFTYSFLKFSLIFLFFSGETLKIVLLFYYLGIIIIIQYAYLKYLVLKCVAINLGRFFARYLCGLYCYCYFIIWGSDNIVYPV